jgi:sensor c-di-GMP phosphodiesterase-like protein
VVAQFTQAEADMVRTAMIAVGVILGVVLVVWVVVYVIPRRKEKQKRLSQYYPPKELGVAYEPVGNERFITLTTQRGFSVQKVPVEQTELTIVADPDGSPMIKDV